MAVTAEHIRSTLDAYLGEHPEEKLELASVIELLDAGVDLTSRHEFRGHMTAAAVLTDPVGRVLHIHHRILSAWLIPGGHLEPGDTTFIGAALRELAEETGIQPGTVAVVSDRPIQIDVHSIPANKAKGEPAHRHIDVRFLLSTAATTVTHLQADEVTGAAWHEVGTLTDVRLRARVAAALC
jgi:8-oxo-dGTP pyrophosphatase MutT (NUDIX family)